MDASRRGARADTLAIGASQKYVDQGLLSKWLLVRYNDPAWRLRFRVEATSRARMTDARAVVCKHIDGYEKRVVSGARLKQLTPELIRYGGADALKVCESIFYEDSRFISDVLNDTALIELDRLHVAVRSSRALAGAPGLSLPQRCDLFSGLREAVSSELNLSAANRKSLSALF